MNRDELDDLLWELIDGELGGEERAVLEARLAADPQARERLRRLEALAGLFPGVERVEPPAGLPAAIARAVAGRHPRPRLLAAARAWLRELFVPRWRVRLAWACAGGALGIALALLHPALRSTAAEDVSRYYGAMARPAIAAETLLELPGGRGRLTFDRSRALLGVRLVGAASAGAGSLELAAPGLVLRAVEERGRASHRVSASERGVVLEWAGEGVIEVAIAVPPSTVRLAVRLVAGPRPAFERDLDLAAPAAAGAAPTSGGPGSN